MTDLEFVECEVCAAKPGTPPLCAPCLRNRDVIEQQAKIIRGLRRDLGVFKALADYIFGR